MDIVLKYFADFTPEQLRQFQLLEPLYREWNEKINVVSRKDIDSLYEKHVLHSLSIATQFYFPPGSEVVDLGTGGGFPGVPLAIFYPEVKFLLVDSIAKKLKVIEAVCEAADIKNITTRHSRIEAVRDRKFDYVVSRAVAQLKDLWQWSRPLLHTRSRFADMETDEQPIHKPGLICLKGGDLNIEIQESGTRPRVMAVTDIFPEESFADKYILYVPR